MISKDNIQHLGKGKRIESIDLIKFVAMIMVLGLHQQFGRTDDCHSTQVIASLSGIAIPLFFMVNGFLMTLRDVDYKYVVKKIFRIVRFVVLMGVVYWLWFHVRKGDFSPVILCKNIALSLIQQGDMRVFWFFWAMIILYLLMPVVNRLSNRYKAFLPSAIAGLFVIQFVVFSLNLQFKFEENVNQTLRIWNWLFYFLLGAGIRRYSHLLDIRIHSCSVLFLACVYVWFIYQTYDDVGSRDMYFGATACFVYAILLFLFILQRWEHNELIEKFSNLFLPVYALHPIYFGVYYKLVDTSFMGEISPVFDFVLNTIILIVGCHLLMKIPYADKIFRI